MFGRVASAWIWFLDGLAEALRWCLDRARARALYRIDLGEGAGAVLLADGSRIGTAGPDPAAPFDPPALAARLAGSSIDIMVPSSWLFRRDLEPVALQSVPFLDAFVRHHIERITPWRAADVFYGIRRTVLAGDPGRVAIEVGVVPRRLVEPWVAAVEAARPHLARIVPLGATAGDDMAIALGQGASARHLGQWRRGIGLALLAGAIGWAGLVGWLWWQAAEVRAEIDELDGVMERREAVLARARHGGPAGGGADERIRAMLKGRFEAAGIIDALSAALPDTAHLTKLDLGKDHLTIAGVSTDTPSLVPALEASRRFAGVAFGAPTTKVEAGVGDRFQLDMRLLPPDAGAAP